MGITWRNISDGFFKTGSVGAIAVAESGPEKLKVLKDPFGTGPFEYRALDKGFELKSKLQYEGQPVTLMVGQRKKN